MGNPLTYWGALEARQSEWAFRAYDQLIRTLSPDVQDKLSRKDDVAEPYVVIFGKTQVGKTTLLLDLMGIAPEHLATVSLAMRGGRASGNSSTATAMEYCRSADQRWALTTEGETRRFDSDEAVSDRLGKLRLEMEAGNLIVTSPCVVHIPRKYFSTGAASPHVRMLDLPGDNPANSQEQEHVYRMAKAYLPFADLVLLVGRGDDLGFLRPEVITLPGIEDWQTMPHRFRIVTTYSYTAQSIKDFIRNDPDFDVAQLRHRLIQQIELFGTLSGAAKAEDLYFPLEFGTSWQGVEAQDPALHARMAPIIEQLRGELITQITLSTSPMGRLRSTLNTHLGVEHVLKRKAADLHDRIALLEGQATKLTADLEGWKQLVGRAEAAREKVNSILVGLDDAEAKKAFNSAEVTFTQSDPYPPKEKSGKDDVSILKLLISMHRRALQSMQVNVGNTGRYWSLVRGYFSRPAAETVQSVLDDSFWVVQEILNDYWFDAYWDSSNYQKDRKMVLKASCAARSRLIELYREAWLNAKTKADVQLAQEKKSAEAERLNYLEEYESTSKVLQVVKNEICLQQAELENLKLRSKEDLERCARFRDLLNYEYLRALNEQMDEALVNDDDCESLLQILSCEEMRNQHASLMTMYLTEQDQSNASDH